MSSILLYPFLTDELKSKIRFQNRRFEFYYNNKEGEEKPLTDEPIEAMSSIYCIKDQEGVWTQDDYDLGFKRKYCLRTFQCLFGKNGIASINSKLGLAIVWTSSDSKQRGVVEIGKFSYTDRILDIEVEKNFGKAQLRGEVNFTTILYISEVGTPEDDELHLANYSGYVLGELDSFTIRLDGNGSVFPVFEVSEKGQPLWYVKCDWIDPTIDSFSDYVSINLNTAHKNYKYIDREQKCFNSQLLGEIMASAIGVIIDRLRTETGYWEQIMSNDSLEQGSVGQAVYYFAETLEWDLSTPESVAICTRKFFDQRM